VETSLHRQLKARYGPDRGGRSEVVIGGFRIDAVDPDGTLIEVQSAALGPLRGKLARLLPDHRIRVIKPVVVSRRIVRRARADGPDLSARSSPKRGDPVEVFDVLAVAIDEVRIPRRRRPGYAVVDRRLREILGTTTLHAAGDVWALLPVGLPDPFTTRELADRLDRPEPFAQRVAYCLRLAGAVDVLGKRGNRLVYGHPACRAQPPSSAATGSASAIR